MAAPKPAAVLQMSGTVENPDNRVEIIDAVELASRIKVPVSWVRQHTTARYPFAQRIPCLKVGRYTRFRWNSPELNQWLRSLETR